MRLANKVALISGGARGMGAVEARLFTQESAKVCIADIREDQVRALSSEIADAGGEAMFVRLDVNSEREWTEAVDAAVSAYGRLDILVNNAGIYQRANVEETSAADWDRMLSINGRGVFIGTKAAIPAMRAAGGGSIVNISSVAGIIGSAGATAYNASKGAVRLLTKSTAVQHAAENIRANSVHPGPIETDMLDLVFPEDGMREARALNIPLGRMGRAEDVAKGALFLASDESSYMTGSELVIDGGFTAT